MGGKATTWLAAAGCAVVLAACGGDGSTEAEEAPPGPTIPAGVAQDLAAEADRLAQLLAEVRTCDAAYQADVLLRAVQDSADEIPEALEGELVAVVTELQNDVNCPQPPEDEEKEEKDEGKDNGKGNGKEKEGTEEEPDATTTVER